MASGITHHGHIDVTREGGITMFGSRQFLTAAICIVHPAWVRRVNTEQSVRWSSTACTRLSVVVSVVMTAMVLTGGHAGAQDFPADASRGKIIYERHCLACHGQNGRGDGPDAAAMKVAPANFHQFKSYVKSDEELLRTIEQGVVFSPMHSWQGQLTEPERQDVLAYIRLLVQQGR